MTVLGRHTGDEVKELIAAKDFDIERIQHAADGFLSTWDSQDIDASALWDADWKVFLARYGAAKERVQPALGDTFAEDAWNDILSAVRLRPDVHSATDLQVLYTRLTQAMGRQVDFSGHPQPAAGEDSDLVFFQETKPIANLVEAGVGLGTHGLDMSTKILIGLGLGVVGLIALKR